MGMTMQVTETLSEGLRRELKVVVPAAVLEERMMDRLVELKERANIRGFRPGKVPMNHLRKMYGKSAMAEVVQKSVESSSREALLEKNLKPAYQPEITLPQDQAQVNDIMDGKADLAYTMAFEVVPAIDIQDFAGLKLEKLVVEATEAHVDEALANIATQYKDHDPKDGPAAKGDRVTISFVGRVGGKPFEGGSADEVPLDIGSGSFIPGFEDQLEGAAAGDERLVKVTFPAEYGVKELAGKEAEFEVKVVSVAAPKETVVDDEFAKKLGLESLDKLRETVKARIEGEFAQMSGAKLKRDMLDALDKQYAFDLPARLVDAEFAQIWQALEREMKAENKTFEDEGTTEEETRAEYRTIAERRVRLGLVLGTIGEQAGGQVGEDELQRTLIDRVRQFPGQEKQVYEFYRNNPAAMMELRGPIFEQKVVDHIAGKIELSERKVSRETLRHMLEHDHAPGEACDHPDHDHSHDHGHDHDHDHGHGEAAAAKPKPAKKAAKKAAKPEAE